MVLELPKGEFVMQRVKISKVENKIKEPKVEEGVSATKDQVVGKWYLKSRTGGTRTRYRAEIDKLLANDLYLKLAKNGRLESEVLIVGDRKKWYFGKGNKSLIFKSTEGTNEWYILSISENEMVLRKGKTEEVWNFSTKR